MKKSLNLPLIKIVNILSDGQHHDGTAMGKSLQMTRSAVWKIIKKLERYGVKIESVKGKGYALQEPLALLDLAKIKKNLHHDIPHFDIYESIPSTSNNLRQDKDTRGIKICMAEHQSEGRGRRDSEWYSPFGKNIYLSCRYPFQKDISELAGLSLVAGVAIAKTLKEFGIDEGLAVKWPNDILVKHKKISGTLIDIQGESHGKSQVIIGIGINVNMLEVTSNITTPWTSLRKELGAEVDRNLLAAHLLNTLMSHLQQFEAEGLVPFVKEWVDMDCLLHQRVTLKQADKTIKGMVVGINESGHLLLEMPNGVTQAFASGEAALVRKQ